jgi:hypothetical protein
MNFINLLSIAYKWQCGLQYLPLALLALVSLTILQNELTDNAEQYKVMLEKSLANKQHQQNGPTVHTS